MIAALSVCCCHGHIILSNSKCVPNSSPGVFLRNARIYKHVSFRMADAGMDNSALSFAIGAMGIRKVMS